MQLFAKSETQSDTEFFTMYDSKTQSYEIPMPSKNKNDIVRDILNMFKDQDQSKNKYLLNAEDYSIFKVGSYSKQTGEITSQKPEHVANLHDLRSIAKPNGIVPT